VQVNLCNRINHPCQQERQSAIIKQYVTGFLSICLVQLRIAVPVCNYELHHLFLLLREAMFEHIHPYPSRQLFRHQQCQHLSSQPLLLHHPHFQALRFSHPPHQIFHLIFLRSRLLQITLSLTLEVSKEAGIPSSIRCCSGFQFKTRTSFSLQNKLRDLQGFEVSLITHTPIRSVFYLFCFHCCISPPSPSTPLLQSLHLCFALPFFFFQLSMFLLLFLLLL